MTSTFSSEITLTSNGRASPNRRPVVFRTKAEAATISQPENAEEPVRIEGWLKVCESEIPQRSHSASNIRQYMAIPWHPGYVVVRRDEQSLVCYKSEQAANRCGRRLPRVRLDGGYRAFYRKWGYPALPPPASLSSALHPLLTPTPDANMFAETEDYEDDDDEEDEEEMEDVNGFAGRCINAEDNRRRTTEIMDVGRTMLGGGGDFMDTVSLHENLVQAYSSTLSRIFHRKPKFGRSDTSFDLVESSPALIQSLDRRATGWPFEDRRRLRMMPLVGVHSGLQHSSSGVHMDENHFSMIESPSTSHKLASFLSRPFRNNPLKRTKSVSKLDRKRSALDPNNATGKFSAVDGTAWSTPALNNKNIRNSRSHESLLSYSTTTHAIDLASPPASSQNHNYNNGGGVGVTSSSGGCTVTPLHSSVLGTPHCFQIRADSGATKYYACRTAAERDRWLECLNRTMMPNQEQVRRQDNSLQIWILEVKGVPAKRKYYCELCLDHTLYSRTTAKLKTELCFWGEQFEINHLPKLEAVCINLYREADRKKKKDRNTLVGYVRIPVHVLSARHPVEKWYCVSGAEKMSGLVKGETPALRVKAKYQSVTILPLRAYDGFLQYLQRDYLSLCLALEPSVSVKAKEDFATSMVRVLHKQRLAKEFLCDLIMSEVKILDNEHLMFRGNSLATKAMEAYMKLVGDQYLHDTMAEFIQTVMESDEDCEVDPQKLSTNLSLLPKNQETLTNKVHLAWGKIVNSFYDFPLELRQVFFELRQRLHRCERSELADYLISSSIFLRFLCPAILSPSLFNLVQEYPSGKTARSLTLIAKTIQTLANFTRFGGKEHYMEFMNKFIEGESDHMRQYLMRISSPVSKDYLNRGLEWEGCVDIGKELSLLHSYLTECWVSIDIKRYREAGLHDLQKTLEQLTEAVQNPTSPLNSAFPSGSLSPISPISDYENNNTADDSSPASDAITGNNNFVQTMPGARSYSLYKTSPLVGPYAAKRTIAVNDNDQRVAQVHHENAVPNGSILRTPASNLQTDDDYVWYSALRENLHGRQMPVAVTPNVLNSKPKEFPKLIQTPPSHTKTGQLVAGNGTEAISFVDDQHSDYFSRPLTEEEDDDRSDEFVSCDFHNRRVLVDNEVRQMGSHGMENVCVVHGSSPNGPTIIGCGPVSSGYQSMNYSTSNSSSPVDSGGSTGNTSQSSTATKYHRKQQRSDDAELQKRAAPLAIANPLYSMQMVPLVEQKAPSYSLPDIHHQAPMLATSNVVTEQPQRQRMQLPLSRDQQSGSGSYFHCRRGYPGSPDSSFEDQHKQTDWPYVHFNDRQHSHQTPPQPRMPPAVLSHSLTPQVLQSLVTQPRNDKACANSMANIGSMDRSPASHHKSPLPRTNPRYAMGVTPMSPRLNGNANGNKRGVPSPIRRTKTENGVVSADAETADDAELSQKFIEELESMKRRLEETQSRILTEEPVEKEAARISTAPSTLARRNTTSLGEQNQSSNGRMQQGDSQGKWTDQVKPIISRLKVVEHELQEELNSSMKKQQIIEAQQKRIDMLVTANERLMATLSQLKDRYTTSDDGDSRGEEASENGQRPRHSKVCPVLPVPSSGFGDEPMNREQRLSGGQSSENGQLTSAPSDLSSVESYGFMRRSSSSSSLPRCSSPQPPPQPMLPAPVLPQQRSQNCESYVTVKMTEC